MKHFVALTCEALARSLYAVAAAAPHTISIRLFRQGLHNTPNTLRDTLQAEIDTIQPGTCDAIVLAYGMCGLSTVGLTAWHTPLVIPRTHDCIAIYLGSHQRYQVEFDTNPGTYWYSLDYMERNEAGAAVALGAASLGAMDGVYEDYVARYGQDNADYLMEVMGEWGKHYNRAVYIDMGTGDGHAYEQMARDEAARRGWTYERKQGDPRLLRLLVSGDWPEDEFLVVPPGNRITQAAGDGLIQVERVGVCVDAHHD
ncbi:MAG: DUF1638 domain-containing protein [Anaerolineae bacterium]|nr:DUF1638 domain-containing protein [Anaerolineae bacterium]